MAAKQDNKSKTTKKSMDTALGHVQPQALEIEQAVLASLMIDKDAFYIAGDNLKPEIFYDKRHAKIYAAIRTLQLEERPVDLLTVIEQLKRDKTLEDVGGEDYVIEISALVASSAHIEEYTEILARKNIARQLITYSGNIQTKAFDESIDVYSLMQEAEGDLFTLSQKNMKQDFTQIDPVIKQAIDILQKASANTGGLTGIPTGYEKLNDMTSGWQASDLIIIAGRPAMGKTSFALSLAKNMAVDHGYGVAFFSLEMNNVQLVNRLISNVCEISGKKILNGQLDPPEWERLDNNIRKLIGSPIYVDDTPGLSVFELRTKARRLVREKDVKVIMIDYLQLMNASGAKFGSRQEEVSTISRSLKGLAKELDLPVIALSQLNRTVEGRDGIDGKRPQLSDLRESGAIEQDADMVLFVHRPEYYGLYNDKDGNNLRGMAQIIIAKHRKGATGDVLLKFKGEYTRFQDPGDDDIHMTMSESEGEIIGSRMNGPLDEPDFVPRSMNDLDY